MEVMKIEGSMVATWRRKPTKIRTDLTVLSYGVHGILHIMGAKWNMHTILGEDVLCITIHHVKFR